VQGFERKIMNAAGMRFVKFYFSQNYNLASKQKQRTL